MASTTRSSEWLQPAVAAVSIVSGVISVALFALQIVPGGLVSGIVAGLALAAAIGGTLALRRGRVMDRVLSTTERSVAWSIVSLALLTSLVVGGRAVSGILVVPKVEAASASELEQPYPRYLVDGSVPGLYDMHKTSGESKDALSIRYYVVSDPEFWDTLFTGTSSFADRESLLQPPEEWQAAAADRRLIATLLNPSGSGVVNNEPLKYASFLWERYLVSRRPVGKLTQGVTSLQGRVGFDGRFKRDRISDDLDVVWFEGDNTALLKNGWLDLDPLSREIVQANPELDEPIVKAGGVAYNSRAVCGDGTEGDDFEYAFVVPRKLQLVLLDIENTSGLPVEQVIITYSTAVVDKNGLYVLWDDAHLSGALAAATPITYRVPGGLDPGEHALLPIGVRIGQFDTSNDYDPTAGTDLGYIGPIAGNPMLDTGTGFKPVRAFDPTSLTFVSVGTLSGSCPEIATWSEGAGRWVKERNVLVGARSSDRARTENWALQRFDGRVELRERDAETTFIDEVTIEATDETGSTVTLIPNDPKLADRDEHSVVLRHGDSRVLTFVGWRAGLRDPRVVVSGWYLPDSVR